jgi:hypothetical protein
VNNLLFSHSSSSTAVWIGMAHFKKMPRQDHLSRKLHRSRINNDRIISYILMQIICQRFRKLYIFDANNSPKTSGLFSATKTSMVKNHPCPSFLPYNKLLASNILLQEINNTITLKQLSIKTCTLKYLEIMMVQNPPQEVKVGTLKVSLLGKVKALSIFQV